METQSKPPRQKKFNHRPFSMTVASISDMDMFSEVGDVGLTMNLKMNRKNAGRLSKRINQKLDRGDDYITFTLRGKMKEA